jgi:hypothetical protein
MKRSVAPRKIDARERVEMGIPQDKRGSETGEEKVMGTSSGRVQETEE